MWIADAHVHFFSRRFFDLLTGDSESACRKLGWDLPSEDPAELARTWAATMDSNQVAKAAIIASIPGDEDSVIRAAGAVPGRFYRFAMVNPKASSEGQVHTALDAVCLFPAMQGYSIAGPEADAVIRQAAVVFVHCGVLSVGVRKKLGLPSRFDMRFSNPLEIHPVALRYPDKRFIVPHFGAGMFREALMLCDLCPNVLLDTSSSNSWMNYEGLDLDTVFRRSLDVAGPKRLLFGTDSSFFPRGWNRDIYDSQKAALDKIGVSNNDQQLIFSDNLQLCSRRGHRR